MKPRLILASASPRRKQLLEEAGYEFEVDPPGIDEPEPRTRRSSLGLCRAPGVAQGRRGRPAPASGLDPGGRHICVVDGEILNKPSTGPTPSG